MQSAVRHHAQSGRWRPVAACLCPRHLRQRVPLSPRRRYDGKEVGGDQGTKVQDTPFLRSVIPGGWLRCKRWSFFDRLFAFLPCRRLCAFTLYIFPIRPIAVKTLTKSWEGISHQGGASVRLAKLINLAAHFRRTLASSPQHRLDIGVAPKRSSGCRVSRRGALPCLPSGTPIQISDPSILRNIAGSRVGHLTLGQTTPHCELHLPHPRRGFVAPPSGNMGARPGEPPLSPCAQESIN